MFTILAVLFLDRNRWHNQILLSMKHKTQIAQCLLCHNFEKCPLACGAYSFCPRFSPFVKREESKVKLTEEHRKLLFIVSKF